MPIDFREQAVRMSDAVVTVSAAVARYLDDIGVARSAIAWQTLSEMNWREAGLLVEKRTAIDVRR